MSTTSADGALPEVGTNYRRCFYRTRCRGSASRVPGLFWGSWGYSPCLVVVTASLERTARLLGRSRGDDIARFSDNDYEHAAALEGGIWNTAQDRVEEKKIHEHRPLKIVPWATSSSP